MLQTLHLLEDEVDVGVDERANQVPLTGLIHTDELGTAQDTSEALLVELTDVTLLLLLLSLGLILGDLLLLGAGWRHLGLLGLLLGWHRHRDGLGPSWLLDGIGVDAATVTSIASLLSLAIVAVLLTIVAVVVVAILPSWRALPPLHHLLLLLKLLLLTILGELG